ncbi:MAG: hypothetical protein DHS20C08_21700 [Rhodomicrobium sp.]|nr:MAG: hypothetical protein DHS20C08_21700 [Rhodomicrobium sp.]
MLKKATLALAASILFAASAAPLNAQNLDPRTDDFWASLNLASRLSASVGSTFIAGNNGGDNSAFTSFLSSSTAFMLFGLNFQSDSTFLYEDFNTATIKEYGSILHINRRDPTRYMYGISLAHHTYELSGTPDIDTDRIGGEAEYYRDRFTLGGAGGYIDVEGTEAWYGKLQLRYYLTDDIKVEGYYGHVDFDPAGVPDLDYGSVTGLARLPGTSASLFAQWNGLWLDNVNVGAEAHEFKVGVKIELGNARYNTVKHNDRTYFTDACTFEHGALSYC